MQSLTSKLIDTATLLGFVAYLLRRLRSCNLVEVVPGKFYRAAQPTTSFLEEVIPEKNIQTVINLRRGIAIPKEGSESERETVTRLGADYFHHPFVSSHSRQTERIEALLDTFRSTRLPILIHCADGVHRSGIASALWLIEMENLSIEDARKQLSPQYGYIAFERTLRSKLTRSPSLETILDSYATRNSILNHRLVSVRKATTN